MLKIKLHWSWQKNIYHQDQDMNCRKKLFPKKLGTPKFQKRIIHHKFCYIHLASIRQMSKSHLRIEFPFKWVSTKMQLKTSRNDNYDGNGKWKPTHGPVASSNFGSCNKERISVSFMAGLFKEDKILSFGDTAVSHCEPLWQRGEGHQPLLPPSASCCSYHPESYFNHNVWSWS